jgi:hypothetical protein
MQLTLGLIELTFSLQCSQYTQLTSLIFSALSVMVIDDSTEARNLLTGVTRSRGETLDPAYNKTGPFQRRDPRERYVPTPLANLGLPDCLTECHLLVILWKKTVSLRLPTKASPGLPHLLFLLED